MEEGFKKSVDTIMQKFSGNEETKKFALQYLQLGFKEIGQEKVLQYIDENYQELVAQCHDEANKEAFETRMAGYAALKEGMKAPNITFANNSSLYELESEQTLVVFWASWCPHCMEEMPKLQEWAKNNPDTFVLAVSLDEDSAAIQESIRNFPDMLHYCDLQKWNGKTVTDYFVVATPSLFLLDKEQKIIEKFSNINSFYNYSLGIKD